MKQVNVKKLILPNIPYVFIALLATKVSEAVRLAPGSDASAKLLNIMTGLNTAFHSLIKTARIRLSATWTVPSFWVERNPVR